MLITPNLRYALCEEQSRKYSESPATQCTTKKRRIENELASTMEAVALAMLLDSDTEFEEETEEDYYDLLSTLALAHDAVAGPRYLSRGPRGSAGRLPIDEVITEYLRYPDQSFLVEFRMHRESFWTLADLLRQRG